MRTERAPAPSLVLTVRDDGAGLAAPADPSRWEREGHMGLVGMRERIAALGGSVAIADASADAAPGTSPGAELRVRVPLARAGASA